MQARFEFYKEAIHLLQQHKIQFLVGGAWALRYQIGIKRDTKDLDIFCSPGDFPVLLKLFSDKGYNTEITDIRWLAKVYKGEFYIDVIFNARNSISPVNDFWFSHAIRGELFNIPVDFVSVEDTYWYKLYVLSRDRYDGADLNHILLKKGPEMNWKHIWDKMDHHWQLLLSQFLNFQFVYPSERDKVPRWLFDELLQRAKDQYQLPVSEAKICLGALIESVEYTIDFMEWGYKF